MICHWRPEKATKGSVTLLLPEQSSRI